MEWTKRKAFIIYLVFLFVCFALGGQVFSNRNVTSFEITCENGSVERFNKSDLTICDGHKNPVRDDVIEINFSLLIHNFK